MTSTEEKTKPTIQLLEIPEYQLVELFQILFKENLFALLSEENQELGKALLTKRFGVDPGEMNNLGNRFTLQEHFNIVADTLQMHEKTSDFWEIVTRIVYIMMMIERNPFIADEIEEIKNVIGR